MVPEPTSSRMEGEEPPPGRPRGAMLGDDPFLPEIAARG